MNLVALSGIVYSNPINSKNNRSVYFDLKIFTSFKTNIPNIVTVYIFNDRRILDVVLINCRKGNKITLKGELIGTIKDNIRQIFIISYECPKLWVRFNKDISKQTYINLQKNYFTNDDQNVYKPLKTKKINYSKIKAKGEQK